VLVWKKGDFMTREQAKQVLIGMGIEEPSDEQVSKYLDSVTGEVKKEKDKNASLQEKANKAADLAKELEELKQQNMTDAEKQEDERRKEKEAVDKELADLKAALAESNKKALTSEITSVFANAGLSTEAYASAIKAFASMPADKTEDVMKEVQSFVNGISEANKTSLADAKAAWEKEVLENTPNPGGGTNGGKKEEKSKAEEYFEKYLPSKGTESKTIGTNAPVDYL
jgi:hypothetical protein